MVTRCDRKTLPGPMLYYNFIINVYGKKIYIEAEGGGGKKVCTPIFLVRTLLDSDFKTCSAPKPLHMVIYALNTNGK